MIHEGGTGARRSAASTVAGLVLEHARRAPQAIAIEDAGTRRSYAELEERTARLAGILRRRGVDVGDRIAVLTENRLEYLEAFIAAARIGAIVACQSWRLAVPELRHCIELVEPVATLVSPGHAETWRALDQVDAPIRLGDDYEKLLRDAEPEEKVAELDPESPYLILYTSGTTGLPKGAVIGHRAEIARNMALRAEFGIQPSDTFVAWSPLYHMGAAEYSLGTLMAGGRVIVVNGFDQARLAVIVSRTELGWLLLMPGMVGELAIYLEQNSIEAKGIRVCGVMADLVPPSDIQRITSLLKAPYANTFGSTETGCPPCSSSLIPIGVAPDRLSKLQSPFCEVRLVDEDGHEVPVGLPGELCMRGPTIFSGYWRATEVNEKEIRGGWFHMGDVFVRNPDGTLDFIDRVKYMIKSGGESIYPAEIERVVLEDPRVADAAVVRRGDPKWGEVPVLFVGTMEGAASLIERMLGAEDELPSEARLIAQEHRQSRTPLPGFGHHLHKPDDPRSGVIFRIAEQEGVAGEHVAAIKLLSESVDEVYGKHITINVTGAIAAALGDCGVPAKIMRGFAIIARTAGLVGHVSEEQEKPAMRAIWEAADAAIEYDGKTR